MAPLGRVCLRARPNPNTTLLPGAFELGFGADHPAPPLIRRGALVADAMRARKVG